MLDALARRYGLYIFDERLLADMRDAGRRALLTRALEFRTEAQMLPEFLARILDFLFVGLIKFLPHQSKEQARAADRLRHLLKLPRREDEGERIISAGGRHLRVVGEVDDSDW